jgi:eukaryotic-like serine/threonine-protein kinase
VYRARYLGMPVALKTCALACNSFGSVQPGLAERFWTELVNHAAARHPFITNVYGGYVDPRNPALHCMVVELCDGTLARALLGATVLQRLTWMKQVLSALSHLHAHGTIHTDIKTENVLLGTDGRAKVMDFGMSHMRGTASSLSTTTVSSSRLGAQGTPAYMAPEVLTKTAPVSRRTDVYSAGVLLWVMATRQEPYDGLSTDMDAFARMVVSGTRPSPSSELPKLMADAGMPPQLGELISAMWDGDASKRPTMAECFNAVSGMVTLVGGVASPPGALPPLSHGRHGSVSVSSFGATPGGTPWTPTPGSPAPAVIAAWGGGGGGAVTAAAPAASPFGAWGSGGSSGGVVSGGGGGW